MRKLIPAFVCAVLLCASAAVVSAKEDAAGSKDHPLLSRMPGYFIGTYQETEFGAEKFRTGRRDKVTVEGRVFKINYRLERDAANPGPLNIIRNYGNAITNIGGAVVYEEGSRFATLKLDQGGKEVWVGVDPTDSAKTYQLLIVEKGAMDQVVTADADAFAKGINATGHVAVYGIYFDTGKADVKPDSGPALAEIAKLLAENRDLKVHVVGHTDSTGTVAANMTLSAQRAEAVLKVLVGEHGISRDRLAAYGVGPLAPVASNRTEEGRALNRRVELVEQ